MEWIEGAVRMTDRERIEGMGLSVKEVVRSVSEAFGEILSCASSANLLLDYPI